jgi:hypothetical protein
MVGFAEDVERVREYVRTLGRDDFFRLYEDGAEHLVVLFNANEDQHRAGILALVQDNLTVTVGRGSAERDGHQRQADAYWPSRQEDVFAIWEGLSRPPVVRQLSFSHDDDGPFLGLGLLPLNEATIMMAVQAFAPYRVKTFEGPDVVPA